MNSAAIEAGRVRAQRARDAGQGSAVRVFRTSAVLAARQGQASDWERIAQTALAGFRAVASDARAEYDWQTRLGFMFDAEAFR
jgi:hypothetical protein